MIEQGTPEWFAQRLGKVTASRVADVTAKTRTGWGASRANYMAALIAERLTGVVADTYQNDAMRRGIEMEPDARASYEFMRDAEVVAAGFVEHPAIPMAGASPDGYVGAEGLVEFKCPNTATHIDTLISGSVDGKYISQVQWQMACTGMEWCDFVSFDDRMPVPMRLFVKRVYRDDKKIGELERSVEEFLQEVDEKIAALSNLYGREGCVNRGKGVARQD